MRDDEKAYLNIQNISLPCPGKINLFLHVLERRSDGYHNIQTVFQFIDWCDVLELSLRSDERIQLQSTMNVSDKDNLVIKAANALRETSACRKGIDIRLEKKLPIGGGLGGGSSNAAATLLGLNCLWRTHLNLNDLLNLGRTLGADVPFFISSHAAWAEGLGDQLTPIILPEMWYVLLVPQISVATGSLYRDPRLKLSRSVLSMEHYQLGQGSNDFEALLRSDYPEIAEALDWLNQFSRARVTGTGSVLFARFDSEREANTIACQAPPAVQARVVKGLNESPLYRMLIKHSCWGVAKR